MKTCYNDSDVMVLSALCRITYQSLPTKLNLGTIYLDEDNGVDIERKMAQKFLTIANYFYLCFGPFCCLKSFPKQLQINA